MRETGKDGERERWGETGRFRNEERECGQDRKRREEGETGRVREGEWEMRRQGEAGRGRLTESRQQHGGVYGCCGQHS